MNNKPGCGCGGASKGSAQAMPDDMRQFLERQVRTRMPGTSQRQYGGRSILDAVSEAAGNVGEGSSGTGLDQVRAQGPDGITLPPLV
jgi:hypothetical protein